jgi:putative tryptophan/tyrosine transport system substrate-binding protein
VSIPRLFIFFLFLIFAAFLFLEAKGESSLPVVAIANYGPHSSLEDAQRGLKEELTRQGYISGKNIRYSISDVGFDRALIPQMISHLRDQKPKVIVLLGTPIAQFAKGSITDIPLVYSVVTDPVEAELLKDANLPDRNMTGSSDRQDLALMLQFLKKLIPKAKTVGLLYASSETNDNALLHMMEEATKAENMSLVAISVDHARDIPQRMHAFRKKVDAIYVGTSGTVQPALPVIASEAHRMRIPVINVDAGAVHEGLVLASFGVNYEQVGVNTGKIVAQILKGMPVLQITPIFPKSSEHQGVIYQKKAKDLKLKIPEDIEGLKVVEKAEHRTKKKK